MKAVGEIELMKLATERVSIPSEYISIEHRKEKSLLKVRFSSNKVRYSKIDIEKSVIYDNDAEDNLVSVEILDFVFEETFTAEPQLSSEVERLRKEKRAAKRKAYRERRKIFIKKHRCQKCGQPKQYVCLEHNQHRKETFVKKLFRKRRYFARKLFFTITRILGFIENRPKRI